VVRKEAVELCRAEGAESLLLAALAVAGDRLRVALGMCHAEISLRRAAVFLLQLSLILLTARVDAVVFEKSWLLYYGNPLRDLAARIEASSVAGGTTPVISNFHWVLRNYLDAGRFVVTPPATLEATRRLLDVLPPGSVVAVSDDSRVSWYEYGNAFLVDAVRRGLCRSCSEASTTFTA
jgi:hypothetical protein